MAKGKKFNEDGVPMVPAVLRLPLGECLTASTKRMVMDLHQVALALRDARNCMARTWQRWREDHPDWKPQQATVRGKLKFDAEGKPVLEGDMCPQSERIDGKSACFQTYLAASAQREGRRVAGVLVSAAAKEVLDDLSGKMPWNHEGEATFRWQAVLWHEVNLASYRALEIPYLNNTAILCCFGHASNGKNAPRLMRQMVEKYGQDSAVIGFPLFSKVAGRQRNFHVCRVNVTAMPAALRMALMRLARGEWKISDSTFVFKPARHNSKKRRDRRERGTWYLHLFYRRPAGGPVCNPANVARLESMRPMHSDPFVVSFGEAHWNIGRGQLFRRLFARLEARRMRMRTDYKICGHGRKGHGQQRNQRDIRPITRAVQNLCNDIAKKTVSDIVSFCQRNDCGTLHWSEPALYQRQYTWFARHDLQWDWTLFDTTLKNACRKARITLIDPIREARRKEKQTVKT